ncbi:dihydroorotase [Flavihumibacter sp. CACIAM 22H1]|uniref:dihydroorotase n=1 Tax=Flavihumibacter sp. CACIAM 22H1 TaxID=1812911 RepID=UPI0007A84910|nr:dihydroorotase [Flavihumibacter sp. CACIAM 22H1]KYP16486.1 MAG: dihydroorotase [Flavihumibacter sp. CACIAM 22H1]
MQKYLIKNTQIVNEGTVYSADILLSGGRIEKINSQISATNGAIEINGEGKYLLPGVIDDQVHFREPGLTHKASIYTESRAAVAGGVTSFMEMPNTQPPVFTQDLLENKYAIGAASSLANYSFFMGTSNDNLEEVLRTNDKKDRVCGIKIFMGSSTGGLLVDNPLSLEHIFEGTELLIATHCEDERIIKKNLEAAKASGRPLTAADHPIIRNEEACFESSFYAIQLAKKFNSRLHILHISTQRELQLFGNMLPLEQKRITSEVCVHHLHFTSNDYDRLGNLIKCNPAIKAPDNKAALWQALLDDRLDIIATDHAPHTWAEKQEDYLHAHAGLPLVQHSLPLMLKYVKDGAIRLEKVVEKMSHAPAICFQLRNRGFIREGYFADLVLIDPDLPQTVSKDNIFYKCGWSPMEGMVLPSSVTHTFVNGHLVYGNGQFDESQKGARLEFDR